jgi:hypothetical protein
MIEFSGIPNSSYAENPAGVVFGGTLEFRPIPEPSSLLLLGLGAIGFGVFEAHRRRHAQGAR